MSERPAGGVRGDPTRSSLAVEPGISNLGSSPYSPCWWCDWYSAAVFAVTPLRTGGSGTLTFSGVYDALLV